jgi:hypothetical protein
LRKEERVSRERSQTRKVVDLVVTMLLSAFGIMAYSSGSTMVVPLFNIPIPAWLFVPVAVLALISQTTSLTSGARRRDLFLLGLPAIVIASFLVTGLLSTLLESWLPVPRTIPDFLDIIGWVLVSGIMFAKTWLPHYRKPPLPDHPVSESLKNIEVLLVHWSEPEARELAATLESHGWRVSLWDPTLKLSDIRVDPPRAVVISLRRLPSHGQGVADSIWATKWGRAIPIVFFDGAADKVEVTRERFPEAYFCSWEDLPSTLAELDRKGPAD